MDRQIDYFEIFTSPFFLGLLVLEFILKAVVLWRCGRNNQLGWYIALLVVNTGGLLPVLYLIFFQKKRV